MFSGEMISQVKELLGGKYKLSAKGVSVVVLSLGIASEEEQDHITKRAKNSMYDFIVIRS